MAHDWHATLHLSDTDDPRADTAMTTAHVVLTTRDTTLHGYGYARRNPGDVDVPEVGEELAAARALRDLADRLLKATSDDISEIEHRAIHLGR